MRVKSALHYRKPAFWVAAAAVLAVVIVAVCFLTNPRSERGSLVWAQKLNAADVASIELYVPAEGEARQYKKLDTEEMAQAVELINSSRGTYIENRRRFTPACRCGSFSRWTTARCMLSAA